MANYYAVVRTNYFSVTNEDKFREIISSCNAEDEICIFNSEDGSGEFAFGCYGSIYGIPSSEDDDEDNLDAFYDALQGVLVDGNAIIITEVGYEKLRYLVGGCVVITKNDIQYVNVCDKALELARTMLNNSKFETNMDY